MRGFVPPPGVDLDPRGLQVAIDEARRRTIEALQELEPSQRLGPRGPEVNPPLWEAGHVAWFQERWTLRRDGEASMRSDADALFDSMAVPHGVRWDLPLPAVGEVVAYLDAVGQRAAERLAAEPSPTECYHQRYALLHEDMHVEAGLWARQLHGWPAPRWVGPPSESGAGAHPGDVAIDGGAYEIGARPGDGFCFDNEKWAHTVTLPGFSIARAPVTQAAFAAFVDAGGYGNRDLWSAAGWGYVGATGARHPRYWRGQPGGWEQRRFDRWGPIDPHHPMIHVSYYEAEAYCRFAGRRLPTEAQWEVAAAASNTVQLGGHAGPVDVAEHPQGDSTRGLRQAIGNVWEWTDTWFEPYPGFVPDPYREYSQPWFYSHRVLRGGAWTTPARMVRTTMRNFAGPTRSDWFAGFRTCAAP